MAFGASTENSLINCILLPRTEKKKKKKKKKKMYIYAMEYYSAIKRNKIESFVVIWIDLESVIHSEVSQKEKNKYCILTHICGI